MLKRVKGNTQKHVSHQNQNFQSHFAFHTSWTHLVSYLPICLSAFPGHRYNLHNFDPNLINFQGVLPYEKIPYECHHVRTSAILCVCANTRELCRTQCTWQFFFSDAFTFLCIISTADPKGVTTGRIRRATTYIGTTLIKNVQSRRKSGFMTIEPPRCFL